MKTATTKTEQSVEQTGAFLAGLQSQRGSHLQTLQTADLRRRKYALKAAQGDAEAKAALAQIVAEEATATTEMKNLDLAIEAATQEHEDAKARRREAQDAEDEKRHSLLGDRLIAKNMDIVRVLKEAYEHIKEREGIASEICQLRLLSSSQMNRLTDSLGPFIMSALQEFAPKNESAYGPEVLLDLVRKDCRLLGKPDPSPPRVLTPTELALQRSIEPSRFGSTKKRAVGE